MATFAGLFVEPGSEGSELGRGDLVIDDSTLLIAVAGQSLGEWDLAECDVQPAQSHGRFSVTMGTEQIDFVPDTTPAFAVAVGLDVSIADRIKEASGSAPESASQGGGQEASADPTPDLVFASGTARRKCPHCKETIAGDARVCRYCGRESDPSTPSNIPARYIKPYYQTQFAKIERNGGGFMALWNWPAFFFGAIWYFAKGMWAKALIYIAFALIVGPLTLGIGILAVWVYGGVAGNYDMYLKERRGTQLW